MKTDLPESLHPLASNHPAGCAWRVLLSPDEWTWTQAEVEAMARAVVALNTERIALREQRNDLKSALLAALKKNAALREDVARLDWLEGQVHRGFYNHATGRTELSALSCHEVKTKGIRAAIDAARKEATP